MSQKKTLTEKMKEQKKHSLIEWLDEQTEAGLDVTLKWEGGNDSGWVYFEVDGDTVENEHTERLINWMYDHLDYGSWAGDFSATGEAIYSSKQKAFVGTDYYSETGEMVYDVNIPIHIAKDLWFNELSLHIECTSDDSPQVEVGFGISNGFLTQEHRTAEQVLQIDIQDQVNEAISDWMNKTGLEFESIWENMTIPYSDFKVVGDVMVGEIEKLVFRYPETDEKEICLDLKEMLNDED